MLGAVVTEAIMCGNPPPPRLEPVSTSSPHTPARRPPTTRHPPKQHSARLDELQKALDARSAEVRVQEQRLAKLTRASEEMAALQDEVELLRPVQAELTKAEVRCRPAPSG